MTKLVSSFLPLQYDKSLPQPGNPDLVQRSSSLWTMDLEEGRRKEVWAALFWSLSAGHLLVYLPVKQQKPQEANLPNI